MTFSLKPTVLQTLSPDSGDSDQVAFYLDGKPRNCALNEIEVVPSGITNLSKVGGWPNVLRLLVACGAPVDRESHFFPYSLLEPEVLDVNLLSYPNFYSELSKAIGISRTELVSIIKNWAR